MTRSALMRRVCKKIAEALAPTQLHRHDWERKNYWLRLAGLNILKDSCAISGGFQYLDGNEENIHIDRYVAIGNTLHLWNFNDIHIGQFNMIAVDHSKQWLS